MSGSESERIRQEGSWKEYGFVTRPRGYWARGLSGGQFCVYVANRLVISSLRPEHLPEFSKGKLTLDALTRVCTHPHFDDQYLVIDSSANSASGQRGNASSSLPRSVALINRVRPCGVAGYRISRTDLSALIPHSRRA